MIHQNTHFYSDADFKKKKSDTDPGVFQSRIRNSKCFTCHDHGVLVRPLEHGPVLQVGEVGDRGIRHLRQYIILYHTRKQGQIVYKTKQNSKITKS